MKRSLALLSGVTALVALALGSGLGRLAAHDPVLARFLPYPFTAEGDRAIAAQALRNGDRMTALAAAQRAVAADPVDPRSAALLGAGHLLSNHPGQADRAFRTAARLGWRDPLTQLYFMDQALRGGRADLAALRLDAVLRQDPGFPARDLILSQFEATENGRAALALRLAFRPGWARQFMAKDGQIPLSTMRHRAAILAAVPGTRWGCDAVAPLVRTLIERGDAPTAKYLWLAHCPDAARTIADGTFARLPLTRPATPFDWNLVGGGDITTVADARRGRGLIVRVSGAASREVAWQLLTLTPADYRLRWRLAGSTKNSANPLRMTISCTSGTGGKLLPRTDTSDRSEDEFKVDPDCGTQYLAIWVVPSADNIRIERIDLEPLQPTQPKRAISPKSSVAK